MLSFSPPLVFPNREVHLYDKRERLVPQDDAIGDHITLTARIGPMQRQAVKEETDENDDEENDEKIATIKCSR